MTRAQRVHLSGRQFALISRAVADRRRYQILEQIAASRQPASCFEIKKRLPISPATLSHHIKELEAAGLIDILRRGKFAHLSLRRDVWQAYLDRLASL